MRNPLRSLALGAVLSAVVTAAPKQAGVPPSTKGAAASKEQYMFVFGDSYSTVNFQYKGAQPTAANPIGNPGLPGGTTSNGLNWVGYLISKGNTTTTLTWDFAVTGATTDKQIVDTYAKANFDDQVKQFVEIAGNIKGRTPANTVAVVWMGINDVGTAHWKKTRAPIDTIMKRYFSLLQTVAEKGNIKKFVLLQIPPLKLLPAFANEKDVAGLLADIDTYNADLKDTDLKGKPLKKFLADNKGVEVLVWETKTTFERAVKNPAKTCGKADGSCLWADSYHPGTGMHKIIAEAFKSEVESKKFFTF